MKREGDEQPLAREDFDRAAAGIAARFAGATPVRVRRFGTGMAHFVYEAAFAGREPVVVRLTRPGERHLCANAAALSRRLRPLGVPLPEILADGASAPIPYLILERLPGSDLGDVIAKLPTQRLDGIAGAVARAQAIVAGTPSAGRYGYAADPGDAPFPTWSQVLDANIARARVRMAAAQLFDATPIARLEALVAAHRGELNVLPATAFLHDTTTKNVIVTPEGAFSGIVNVDDLCYGDPRYAAALMLTAILNIDGPAGYVDAWLQHAGQPKDRLFWLYVAVFTVDFMGEHGQIFNGNQRPSTQAQRDGLLRQVEFAAANI